VITVRNRCRKVAPVTHLEGIPVDPEFSAILPANFRRRGGTGTRLKKQRNANDGRDTHAAPP
jgi:hypothetical protein